MLSSMVQSFTDPEAYAGVIPSTQVQNSIVAAGQFEAKATLIELHDMRMQRFSDNLPRVSHTATKSGQVVVTSFRLMHFIGHRETRHGARCQFQPRLWPILDPRWPVMSWPRHAIRSVLCPRQRLCGGFRESMQRLVSWQHLRQNFWPMPGQQGVSSRLCSRLWCPVLRRWKATENAAHNVATAP